MKKTFKIMLGTVMALLICIIATGAYLSRNLPAIVEEVVEGQGPKVTGTKVHLGGVRILYGTGRVSLKDLIIRNPSGFSTSHAFKLHQLIFQINIPSIFKDVMVIDEFSIEGASIIAEQTGTSLKTNLQVIADHAKQSSSNNKKSSGAVSDGKPVKLIIREFRFVGNSIDLVSEQWGNRKIMIPDLILKDIGKRENGLTGNQLSQRIIKLVTQQANEAVKDELKRLAKEKAKETVTGKLKEKLGDFFGGE